MDINEMRTKDNHALPKGATYFYVNKYFEIIEAVFQDRIEGLFQFKYLYNAENYVINNMPILSINDITDRYFGRIAIIDLQIIVKQKLSQGFKINNDE